MASTPHPVSFRPSARLQKYLGRELISDPNLAVIEFVKNAYDAGATNVLVDFVLDHAPPRLVIADNGGGMTEEEFRENWMQPGFSHKAQDAPPARAVSGPGSRSEARKLQRVRIPAGEKGLGRMAAGRLGDSMDVYTRPSAELPWFHVKFVWSEFDDMSLPMDRVTMTPDFTSEPPDGAFEAGTVIVIDGLSQKWDGRIRGRPVRGRKRTKLGRLRQDLEYFVRPLKAGQGTFEIELSSDRAADHDDLGRISARTAEESAEYVYSFSYSSKSGHAVVVRSIRRGGEVAEVSGARETESFPPEVATMADADGDVGPAPLLCGPFKGTFYYSPPPATVRAAEALPMGVLLFRDGVWVEPYGIDEDDWIGVAARKAQRQGHAAIQPSTLTGHVEITRESNPELHDMSNRMGLLENDEAEEFLYLVREEFRNFERIVYEEFLSQRWQSKAEKAGTKARGEVDAAAVFMRSLAHSVRQPLEGLQVEVGTLRELVRRDDIPKDARTLLEGVAERAGAHVNNAANVVAQAVRFDVPDFQQVSVADLLEAVRSACDASARSRGVELTFEGPRSGASSVLVPAQLVVTALTSVVDNAVRAERPAGREPTVRVVATGDSGTCMVAVEDNGTGIVDWRPDAPVSSIRSTSGRPGVGLVLAELSARASQGSLKIVASGESGTAVVLTLPTRARGLPG